MSPLEEIKERLSIVEVVSPYVKLTKAGKHYKGLSPFTKEKTPSFFVSPERGLYHCFSTGKGGDAITFIEEMEGVDFQGALKILAEKAGVPLTYEKKEDRDKREKQYKALEFAKKFYQELFNKDKDIQNYLKDRGVNDDSVKRFELGYAPTEWDVLSKKMLTLGYTEEELVTVGLSKKKEGGKSVYDVFRNRIMFPIHDASGRVVAFSGRIYEPREKGEQKGPKYLNTPETPLFVKSRILYGYDKAKQSIRKYNFSLLVEGQMDVVMSHQAGFSNTVAVSGTAFSENHVKLLSRLSNNILMAFDSDQAGIASSGRSASIALNAGMDVKVASLPSGVDPADLVKEDPGKWKEAIKKGTHIVEFYLNVIDEEETDARKKELRVHETVLPLVAQIENRMDQAHFVSLIASRLGSPEEVVWEEVNKKAHEQEKAVQVQKPTATDAPSNIKYSREGQITRELIGILLWQMGLKEQKLDCKELEEKIKSDGEESILDEVIKDEEQKNKLCFLAEVIYGNHGDLKGETEVLFSELGKERTKKELGKATEELKKAEKEGDDKKIEKLAKEAGALSEKLAQFK